MADNTSTVNSLQLAIGLEEEGYRFYSQAAVEAANSAEREMWLVLAHDEAAHRAILEEQLASFKAGGAWVAKDALPLAQAVFQGDRLAIDPPTTAMGAARAAYATALEIEERSVRFYKHLADEVDDGAGRAIFAYLVTFEQGHANLIRSKLAYVK